MPSLDNVASRAHALKRGACLEYGCERMSTRTSIPYAFNKLRNFSVEWLEWPTVNTRLLFTTPMSPVACSSMGKLTDEAENNPQTPLSPDPLWSSRAPARSA